MTRRKPSLLPAERCEQFVRASDRQSAAEIAADIGGRLILDEPASCQQRDAPAGVGAVGVARASAVPDADHGARSRPEHCPPLQFPPPPLPPPPPPPHPPRP